MSGEVKFIKKLEAAVPKGTQFLSRCQESGCRASCKWTPKVIIKGESLASKREKAVDCIFLLFEKSGKTAIDVLLIELKSSNFDARMSSEKFAKSEISVRHLCSDAGLEIASCRRYLFAKRHPRVGTAEYVILAKKSRIRLKSCGAPLD